MQVFPVRALAPSSSSLVPAVPWCHPPLPLWCQLHAFFHGPLAATREPPAPRVMTVGAPATRRCRRTGALLQRSSSIFTPTSDWSWLHKALHKPVQNCSSALSESDRMIYIACRKNNNCFFATNYVKYHQHISRYWTGIRIEQNTRYINFCHFWWLSVSTTSRVKAKVVETGSL